MKRFFKSKNSIVILSVLVVFVLSVFYVVFSGELSGYISKLYRTDELAIQKCKDVKQNQEQCWEDLMVTLAQERGIDVALDVLASVKDTYKPFSNICHDLTHTIGGEAYEQFSADKDFIATPKSIYCNYGFYHGFMEALASTSGDSKEAREFCAYIDSQMAKITPDVSLQCYHGIGHGWTNVHDNPEVWGDEFAIVTPALKLCEETKDTWEQLSRCLTGVFHGIAVLYITGEYGLSIDKENPLKLCHEQEERYRNECYMSMHGVLRQVTGNDFSKAANFIEDILEDKYAGPAIMHLAMATSQQYKDTLSYTNAINLCRMLEPRLLLSCVQGYAFGLFEQNASGEQHKEPLNFCRLAMLSDREQTACLEHIFSYLTIWYSSEKAQNICESIEEKYQEFCYMQLKLR